jgi:glucose-6-phosphate isomerase
MNILQTFFHNVDFNKNLVLPINNKSIISNIQETLNNLPALNIVRNKKLLEETILQASKFAKKKTSFMIFGTGGSSLGAKALINILQGSENINITFYDNIDPINFKNSINKKDLGKIGFIFISKSGSTPETLSQFASLIEIFDQQNMIDKFFKNSLVITEDKFSPLAQIANSKKCMLLKHEKDIGGRYSIFSNVGLIPAIIAGLDVKQIHLGALEEIKKQTSFEFLKIAQFFRFQKINSSITNSVIMTYSDALFFFGKWYLQLWAESLGKNDKGITAMHAVGTTDQHSQLQLYLDGPKDKFFTFITTNHAKKGFKLHSKTMEENDINYLINKTMGDLMQAEQQATIDTFNHKKFSFREIRIPEINEFCMGRLLAQSIMETVATCLYFDVNPFDQPAVEQGKILTKKYLS